MKCADTSIADVISNGHRVRRGKMFEMLEREGVDSVVPRVLELEGECKSTVGVE